MTRDTLRSEDVLRKAQAVGSYYGFRPLSSVTESKRGAGSRAPFPENVALEALDSVAREVAGFLKKVRDGGIVPSLAKPLFLWHTNAATGRPAPRQLLVQFHALGVERAIGDAVLIRAVHSFIADVAKSVPKLRVNSMGDKETRGRFARELGHFFRKQGPALPADCIAASKRDVVEAAEMLHAHPEHEVPSPTDHLSEASRKHFEDVLDYLESTDTPYDLAPSLLSRASAWTETCFEIRADDDIHAWGSRYSEFARPFFKSAVPSVGALVRLSVRSDADVPSYRERGAPRFVFVHIGEEAKRESIKMTDSLRRARLPIAQSIGVESLTEQMRLAEILNPPYLLIMGRKEALERSVILRERSTHTESLIPFDGLVDHLKGVTA